MTFKLFRHKSNGEVRSYPDHYAEHPTIGPDLEPYDPENDEYEEEKVVLENHELPVEQRASIKAVLPLVPEHVERVGDEDEDDAPVEEKK